MGFFKGFHSTHHDKKLVRDAPGGYNPETPGPEEKKDHEVRVNTSEVDPEAEAGVQKVEAVALVWSKKAVWCTYAWIWICFFMLALQQGMTTLLNPKAYADFLSAPQITTASILGVIIGGILRLPIAKFLNVIGRAEGFFFFIVVYLLGMIILAACNGPSSYAAGYVLYWIGYDALYFIMDVFVADTSGLRNRAWAFGFVSTPFICTAFTAPLAATSYIEHSGWRWAYGSFTIIMFFVLMPLVVVFKYYQIKAKKVGLLNKLNSGRTWYQSVIHYIHEFDIIGAFLLMAAFVLFLLPFSLSSYGKAQYSSATFIAMVVVGVCLFPVFAIWERFFARKQFVQWVLLKRPTVLGACVLSATLYFSFYCWDLYFYQFVLVVYNLKTTYGGYMGQIYNVGSCFWSVVFGLWIRQTRHFKYACLFFGLPLMILGAGLMIHFRGNEHGIGYVVMCQIFIAFAGGTLVIGQDMAVMAAADRDGVPLMLALLGLSSSVGGAIGYAVTAAIFDNTFPTALTNALPASAKADATKIYLGGYTLQLTYPLGSEIRDAINHAWSYSQKYETIASTAVLALCIPAIAIWKNYNVDHKQNRGTMI